MEREIETVKEKSCCVKRGAGVRVKKETVWEMSQEAGKEDEVHKVFIKFLDFVFPPSPCLHVYDLKPAQ